MHRGLQTGWLAVGLSAFMIAPGGPPQIFQRLVLDTPEMTARLKPFMALAEQVRAMPPQADQQNRARLAQQVLEQSRQARLDAPIPDELALNALARALASKTGLAALEAKVGMK